MRRLLALKTHTGRDTASHFFEDGSRLVFRLMSAYQRLHHYPPHDLVGAPAPEMQDIHLPLVSPKYTNE
jgi:hypothetical protein